MRRIVTAVIMVASLVVVATGLSAQAAEVWPGRKWLSAPPAEVGVDQAQLDQAVSYAKSFGGSGMVARSGYQIAFWGNQVTRYNLYSATKSLGSLLLGLAVADRKLQLDDQVKPKLPELSAPGTSQATKWLPLITVSQLGSHTAGYEKPGGFGALLFQPGTMWSYSDGGTNWLADLVTVTLGQDLNAVLRNRVLRYLQVATTDLTWRQNSYRPKTLRGITRREFGSGISANVGAMARVGLMMTRGGRWKTRQILPSSYVRTVGTNPSSIRNLPLYDPKLFPGATRHYGLLWWNNADGVIEGLPTDAFWAWGLNDQLILVVPSLDLVAARAGPSMKGRVWGDTTPLQPFFGPLGRSVTR